DNFTVVLGLQPATDVVIDLASNNTAEAVTTPTFLTFTNANWNIPQTVTVTGQDDTVLDGTQNYLINLSINDAVSDDAYDTVADQTVTGTNTDDDNPITSPNLNQEDISIIITNATCADVNNGEILLETSSDFVFRVSLNSVGQNNTISLNTPLRISQLSKGAYTVCLTLDEFPNWEQCYSTSITNFEDLIAEVLEIDSTNQFAQISLQGSLSYEVNVNENNYDYQFSSTSKNTVKVPLASGENTIIIKGDSDCQGIFSQELIVGEIKYYPNPVKSVISINGISGENATYSIFDSSGSLVLSDNSKNQEFLIRINLESLSKGWYFLIITNEIGQYNFKILKE
ncbi:T9SS type A sorting domain-containing protein, partial [Maribacter spongiicola]|uniref:T9SS type A sorting domain-containing protein n=1 Tax=Maribacter spongiicola TaxID=1206753 RepID=UPI00141512F4